MSATSLDDGFRERECCEIIDVGFTEGEDIIHVSSVCSRVRNVA